MVVQLPPAVPPPPSNLDDVMETRKILLSAALESLSLSVSHTRGGVGENPNLQHLFYALVWSSSQRSSFGSGELDSRWNISAALDRQFQGLWFFLCVCIFPRLPDPQPGSLLSGSCLQTWKMQPPHSKDRGKHFNLWAIFEADFITSSEGGFEPLYLVQLPFVIQKLL